jgi:hypothetical protein
MTGPQDPATAGGDRLRAGHADREQTIEALKNAFMQGRLTGEELAARTGQVLAARTYAELDAVTADLPGASRLDGRSASRLDGPGASRLDGRSASRLDGPGASRLDGPSALAQADMPGPADVTRRWPLARASVKSGGFLVIAAAVAQSANIIANGDYGAATGSYQAWVRVLNALALALVITALVILGRGVAASVRRRRSRKHRPPRPELSGHALAAAPHDGQGRDAVPPSHRTDPTRTDPTRTDQARTDQARADQARADLARADLRTRIPGLAAG